MQINNIWTPTCCLAEAHSYTQSLLAHVVVVWVILWNEIFVCGTDISVMLIRAICLYYVTTIPSDLSTINPFSQSHGRMALLQHWGKVGNVVKDEVALDMAWNIHGYFSEASDHKMQVQDKHYLILGGIFNWYMAGILSPRRQKLKYISILVASE